MGKVLSLNLQKGGVSKTTSTVAIAYLLSQEHNKKVLCIDFDSQGNSTYILTQQSPYDFRGRSVLEALKEEQYKDFIVNVGENLDLLPSNAFLATLPGWLYTTHSSWGRKPWEALSYLVKEVQDDYDLIIVDTPPNLGDLTTNALFASDYAIIPVESSMLAFQEIDPQLELIDEITKRNNNLKLLGILANVIDKRRTKDNEEFFTALDTYYKGLRFESIIYRTADGSRVAKQSLFTDKKYSKKIFEQYEPFIKELLEHVRI